MRGYQCEHCEEWDSGEPFVTVRSSDEPQPEEFCSERCCVLALMHREPYYTTSGETTLKVYSAMVKDRLKSARKVRKDYEARCAMGLA